MNLNTDRDHLHGQKYYTNVRYYIYKEFLNFTVLKLLINHVLYKINALYVLQSECILKI